MVRIHPDPPSDTRPGSNSVGAIAQLGERLLCKQEVTGSIPVGSTSFSRKLTGDRTRRVRWPARFIRLLFKNSEEVKRIRFSQTGFVWV